MICAIPTVSGSGRPGHQQMQRFQPRRNGRAGDQHCALPDSPVSFCRLR